MSSRLKLAGICFAAAFALAACGGGGGGSTADTMMPDPPEPTPQEMCEADGGQYANGACTTAAELAEAAALDAAQMSAKSAADAANMAAGDAEAAAEAQMANMEHDEASYALAKNAAERARTAANTAAAANAAAQAATTSAEAEEQQAAAEAAQTVAEAEEANAIKYAGMVYAAKMKADADAIAAAAMAAATKAAGTKLKAMGTEAGQTTDAGLGGTARTDADGTTTAEETSDDVYSLTIKRDRTSTTITVKDPNRPSINEPKFKLASDLGDGRQMLVLKNDANEDGDVVEEVVIVGTDIRAPRAIAFARVMGQALNARDLDPADDADKDGTATNDFTALTVAGEGTSGAAAAVRKLVMSNAFTAATDAVLTFDHDMSSTDKDEAYEVAGTYNGAFGTYRCDGTADCTVTIGPDSMDATKLVITNMSAGWVFTPNAGATSDVPDASYLHYGFWLKKTTDEDGVLTYNEVETFAGASIAASSDVSSVTGTASYDGEAVGVYVHHVNSEGGGKVESSTSGHFKADASLTATFGQVDATGCTGANCGTIAPNLLNSITGTIDNFALSGGEEQDWSVNLKGDINTAVGTVTSTNGATGGGSPGAWNATFHGSVTEAGAKPSAVVGEFNANMSNGSVAGAFGANKQ